VQERGIDGMGKVMNEKAYLLLKYNLETKQSQETLRAPVMWLNPWIRIIFSYDEKSVLLLSLLLLGFGETYEDYGDSQNKIVGLRNVDFATKETKQFVYKHEGRKNAAWQMVLFSDGFIALTLNENLKRRI
jgi:hypothetical protein